MRDRIAALALLAVGLTAIAGCKVQVAPSGHGDDQNVKISTPLGGLSVQRNQTDAGDLGLPVYPGAQLASHDDTRSANIDMGFGSWQLRVKVVNYTSSDPREKVVAFYRNALDVFGDVIECNGNQPVGVPAATRQGLTCSDSDHSNHDFKIDTGGLELKAGSGRHQHLVVFRNSGTPGSNFALIALDLPHAVVSGSQETN
jgi:hypothetical protein